ncbi:MAG: hypothetical protein IJZ30_00330 [Alphaproteobacteria bacterium]|nr:hypothetical protein [Alphaproteobacteria bacterium]
MEKKLIARLNEIGLEVGYPYEVLKNGQYRKTDTQGINDDVALVVYGPVQTDCILSEMAPMEDNKRQVWSQLFPKRPSLKDAVLTQQELSKLILFGHRHTVVNYLGKKNLSERTARLLVARNDDELLYKIRTLNLRLPSSIAVAAILYMSDARFVNFINEGAKRGFYQFLPQVEEVLIKQGSLTKFKAYIKHFGLREASELLLVKTENTAFLKAYVDVRYSLNKSLEEAMSVQSQYKKIYEIYQELKANQEEKNTKR